MQQEAATINDGEEGKETNVAKKEMAEKSTWESSWKS